MADRYVCGHGSWRTVGMGNVFVEVPATSQVVFYKEVGETMSIGEARQLLRGEDLPVARTIGGGFNTPNMWLSPAPEFMVHFQAAAIRGGADWYFVEQETSLETILARFSGDTIHWIACSSRDLEEEEEPPRLERRHSI